MPVKEVAADEKQAEQLKNTENNEVLPTVDGTRTPTENDESSPSNSPDAADLDVSRRSCSIDLSGFNLNEEDEKVLSEMLASSSNGCSVSYFFFN